MKKIILFLTLISIDTFAQQLMYPELNVVPRASERIRLEAMEEARGQGMEYLPLILPGLMTLTAGAMASGSLKEGEEESYSPAVAIGIGAVTVLATSWAALSYKPYRSAYKKLKKLPTRNKREQLKRERMAEEEISSLKSIGFKTRLTIAVANAAAAGYLSGTIDDDTEEGKQAKSVAAISQVVSLLPLFFPMRWESVANEQEKYKKRIYAPVAYAPILNYQNQRAVGANLIWTY